MWDKVLPRTLREQVALLPPGVGREIEELRLRAGYPMAAVRGGEEWVPEGWRRAILTESDLQRVLEMAGQGSVHTILDQLRSGFVTAAGGVRIGICGVGAVEDGRLLSFRQVTSLALRVPRAMAGVAEPLLPQLAPGRELPSTLLLSPPGVGKTTRGMSPQVLAADEITDPQDIRAMEQAAGCGVTLLATAHGGSLEDLRRRPLYRELLDAGIFQAFVFLTRQGGKRHYQVWTGGEAP